MEKKKSKKAGTKALNKALFMPSLPAIDEIKLEPVYGSTYCQYSVIENKLEILYKNQEKLLQAIKLLGNDR
jgi:hypothetical protein